MSIQSELDELVMKKSEAVEAEEEIEKMEKMNKHLSQTLKDKQAALAVARDAVKTAKEVLENYTTSSEAEMPGQLERSKAGPTDDELIDVKQRLTNAIGQSEEVAAARALARQYEAMLEELSEIEDASKAKTMEIDAYKNTRIEALAAANMPIDGLTFDDEGLQLNGVPFKDASGAERLIASLAISRALKPDLQDIWVEDAAILDKNSIALVEEFAKENDIRIWLELVGESIDNAIIMVDGMVQT